MKVRGILQGIHEKVTTWMSRSWFVENILIAKVTEENGDTYDCIYCTIIRTILIFFSIGVLFGVFIGGLL